jgi:hypothetical protein
MANLIVGNIVFGFSLALFAYICRPKHVVMLSIAVPAFLVILIFIALTTAEYLGEIASLIGDLTKVVGWYPHGPDVWFPAGAAIWFATIFVVAFLSLGLGRTLWRFRSGRR